MERNKYGEFDLKNRSLSALVDRIFNANPDKIGTPTTMSDFLINKVQIERIREALAYGVQTGRIAFDGNMYTLLGKPSPKTTGQKIGKEGFNPHIIE